MPSNPPLTASGSRELRRPRPIPKAVREAITLMVYGRIDDPDCAPVDFIEAAKLAGLKPDVMRRYLDRAEVRALLRAERRVFRDAICAANPAALRRVRDTSANGMATVAAVRALEELDPEDSRPIGTSSPGISIIVVQRPEPPQPVLDAQPIRTIEPAREPEPPRSDPIFRPR